MCKYHRIPSSILVVFLVFFFTFVLGGSALGQSLEEAKRLHEKVKQLYQQGRYQEAISPAKRALAIREKALGPEHRDVATSLNNLAGLYKALGDYSKAERL